MQPVANGLPRPDGPLSRTLPKRVTEEANRCVREEIKKPKSRGAYAKLTNEDRARIGKYACENGVAAAARYFSKTLHLERPLNESTVRGIKERISYSWALNGVGIALTAKIKPANNCRNTKIWPSAKI